MTLNQGNTLECKAFNFTEKKKSGYCKEAPLNSGQHIQLGSHNKLDYEQYWSATLTRW